MPDDTQEESPITRHSDDHSLRFKNPIPIHYYDLASATFEEDEDSGVTMCNEQFEIKEVMIYTNAELLQLYEKVNAGDMFLPVPLDLQMMFGFVRALGGYLPRPKNQPK